MFEEMFRKQVLFRHELPRLKLHGLWGIYLGDLFRRIATSLIGIYIPIYIWQQTGSFVKIAWYYFIYAFLGFLMAYPGAKLIQKIGVDVSIVLGTFFRAIFIVSLIFAKDREIFFWISAFSFGVCQPFDWLPYHFVISKIFFLEKHFGKATGNSIIIAKIGTSLGPLLGGLVITYWGYQTLYSLAATLLVFAAIMPFLDDFRKKDMYVNKNDIFKIFRDKGIRKHIFAYSLEMLDMLSATIIWPVFLLVSIGNIESSGLLQTLSLLISLGVIYIVSRIVDKKNIKMMQPGSIIHAIGWWGRYFFRSVFSLFAFNSFYNIGNSMVWMPHRALLYARSAKKKTMEFWIVHELICYGLLSLFSLVFILVLGKVEKVDSLMLVVGVISLMSLFLPKLYKNYLKYLENEKK